MKSMEMNTDVNLVKVLDVLSIVRAQLSTLAHDLVKEDISNFNSSYTKTSAFNFDGDKPDRSVESRAVGENLVTDAGPSLPSPTIIRRLIQQRQVRAKFFGCELFADPAWDMLLDLTAARAENVRVSVSSLCIASGVPPTTALRWIVQMTDAGLLNRADDHTDRRRRFITLSDQTANAIARYFASINILQIY